MIRCGDILIEIDSIG